MGGMEILKTHLETATDLAGLGLQRGEVYHSIDYNPVCQRVLEHHNPVHVFKDLLQLLSKEARVSVQRVMSSHEQLVKSMVHKTQSASSKTEKASAKNELKRVGESLLKVLMNCMDQFTTEDLFQSHAVCSKHPDAATRCQVFPSYDGPEDPKEYFMAGTSCTDWSSMGTQTSLAGHTVLPFAVELQLIKRRRPVVFFHECTRNFRPQILQEYLCGFWVENHSEGYGFLFSVLL